MKLLSVSDFRTRSLAPSLASVDAAIAVALELATVHVNALLLNGTFDKGEYTDTFHFNPNRPTAPHLLTLVLRNGFVDTGEPVSVVCAPTLLALEDIDGGEEVAVEGLAPEKGLVHVAVPEVARFFRVTYTAGLDVSQSDPELYVGVPAWLDLLAFSVARDMYVMGNTDPDNGQRPGAAMGIYGALLDQHRRWVGSRGLKPLELLND